MSLARLGIHSSSDSSKKDQVVVRVWRPREKILTIEDKEFSVNIGCISITNRDRLPVHYWEFKQLTAEKNPLADSAYRKFLFPNENALSEEKIEHKNDSEEFLSLSPNLTLCFYHLDFNHIDIVIRDLRFRNVKKVPEKYRILYFENEDKLFTCSYYAWSTLEASSIVSSKVEEEHSLKTYASFDQFILKLDNLKRKELIKHPETKTMMHPEETLLPPKAKTRCIIM